MHNFWLSNNACISHCLGKPSDPGACKLECPCGDGPSCWRAAELRAPPSPLSDHLHPPMCPPFIPPRPLPHLFSSPFLFSSHHYQEGQPVAAPVSPAPTQQALEAATAATVSELNPAKCPVWLTEQQTVQQHSFGPYRDHGACALIECVLVTHQNHDDRRDCHLLKSRFFCL